MMDYLGQRFIVNRYLFIALITISFLWTRQVLSAKEYTTNENEIYESSGDENITASNETLTTHTSLEETTHKQDPKETSNDKNGGDSANSNQETTLIVLGVCASVIFIILLVLLYQWHKSRRGDRRRRRSQSRATQQSLLKRQISDEVQL